jgi:hypothetical protein
MLPQPPVDALFVEPPMLAHLLTGDGAIPQQRVERGLRDLQVNREFPKGQDLSAMFGHRTHLQRHIVIPGGVLR